MGHEKPHRQQVLANSPIEIMKRIELKPDPLQMTEFKIFHGCLGSQSFPITKALVQVQACQVIVA